MILTPNEKELYSPLFVNLLEGQEMVNGRRNVRRPSSIIRVGLAYLVQSVAISVSVTREHVMWWTQGIKAQ